MANPCPDFHRDPYRNPRTGKRIQMGGPTYNALEQECGSPPQFASVASSPRSPRQPAIIPVGQLKAPLGKGALIPTTPFPEPGQKILLPAPYFPVPFNNPVIPAHHQQGFYVPNIPSTAPAHHQQFIPITPVVIPQPTLPTVPKLPAFPTVPKLPTLPVTPIATIVGSPIKVPQPTIIPTPVRSPPKLPTPIRSPPKLPTPVRSPPKLQSPVASPPKLQSPVASPPKLSSPFIIIERPPLAIGEVPVNSWGVAQRQQRASEDRYQVKQIGPYRYYAVFDGHGGARQMGPNHVADYAVEHLHEYIAQALANVDLNDTNAVSNALRNSVVQLDIDMHNTDKLFGSTCTIVMIDDVRNLIYQVNLGDSRSILFTGNNIISATVDHEPVTPSEKARIEAAGGLVWGGRVDGSLMVSRAFGDFYLKSNQETAYDPYNGKVSAVPDIQINSIFDGGNRIIADAILTSDAPYERDAFNDQDLVNMSNNIPGSPNNVSAEMVNQIYHRTTDDTTIMYVRV